VRWMDWWEVGVVKTRGERRRGGARPGGTGSGEDPISRGISIQLGEEFGIRRGTGLLGPRCVVVYSSV
jgi:hypothetical protein